MSKVTARLPPISSADLWGSDNYPIWWDLGVEKVRYFIGQRTNPGSFREHDGKGVVIIFWDIKAVCRLLGLRKDREGELQ